MQDPRVLEGLLTLIVALLRSALALFRSRNAQAIVELALRQQLAVYSQAKQKPQLRPLYYNAERVHTRLRDAPHGRPLEPRPWPGAEVVGLPRVGGLHHRYVWREAA